MGSIPWQSGKGRGKGGEEGRISLFCPFGMTRQWVLHWEFGMRVRTGGLGGLPSLTCDLGSLLAHGCPCSMSGQLATWQLCLLGPRTT